ncbi:MAG: succinate dehydrogenase iron-sulfur subunit, partial [Pseudomonadota bacterium]
MAEFRLPKNSRPTEGRHFPAPEGATNVRRYVIYRYDPDKDA